MVRVNCGYLGVHLPFPLFLLLLVAIALVLDELLQTLDHPGEKVYREVGPWISHQYKVVGCNILYLTPASIFLQGTSRVSSR